MEPIQSKKLGVPEKILLLESLSIFKDTPANILAEIAPLMEEVEYAQNSIIFQEGDTGDCMYIIYKGEVKIHKANRVLTVLKEKEVFGELSLLDIESRSASATAVSNCTLFRMDQGPFYELVENRTEVVRGFIKILCQRLRAQNEKSTTTF